MKKIKSMSSTVIFIGILMILLGIMFCINPIGSSKLAIDLMSVFFLMIGVIDIYSHFKYRALDTIFNRNGALIGILEVIIAIFAFTQKAMTAIVFSYMFSLFILFTGIEMCEYSLTMKKMGISDWLMFMIFSIIFIIDALMMIFSPVGLAFETLTMWISISLIFAGTSLFVGAMRFKNHVIKYENNFKQFLSQYNDSFYA